MLFSSSWIERLSRLWEENHLSDEQSTEKIQWLKRGRLYDMFDYVNTVYQIVELVHWDQTNKAGITYINHLEKKPFL